MKRSPRVFAILMLLLATMFAADTANNFTGEYADKKFMNGQAVLQMSLDQAGNKVTIFFSGVRNDGQGAAPEINTSGTVTGGKVQFKFTDDFNNVGTGTITRSGEDMVVSIKVSKVADSRCLPFYPEGLRLKRIKK
jgi:hypothetical protein